MKKLIALCVAAIGLSAFALTYVTNVTEEMRVRYDAIPKTNGFRLAFAGVPSITNEVVVGVRDIWENGVGLVKLTNTVIRYDGYPTTNKVYDIYYRNVPIYYTVPVTNITVRN